MVKRGRKLRSNKRIVPVAILALFFLIQLMGFTEKASAEESYSVVTNSKYENTSIENLYILMENGDILIKAKSKAAGEDTIIRYLTIGFGISLSQSPNNHTAKGYAGPSAPANVGYLYLNQATEKKILGTVNGYTTTQYLFSADDVNKILGSRLEKITNETMIYLNTIFQSYKYASDGKTKIILKGNLDENGKGGIKTWKDIMEAAGWSPESLAGFAKYFNIPIVFSPGQQPVKIYREYEGIKDPVQVDSLSKNIGTTISLKGRTEYSAEYNEKKYVLNGYEVEPCVANVSIKGSKPLSWTASKDAKEDELMDYIALKKFGVPLGGFKITYKYILKPDNTNSNTLYYKCNDKTSPAIALKTLKVGETLTWKDEAAAKPVMNYFTGSYTLQGYYIKSKKSNKIISSAYKSGDSTLTDAKILNAKAEVIEGGLAVYLVYRGDIVVTPTPTPSVTATPVPTVPLYEIPSGGQEEKPLDSLQTAGMIRADQRGAELFNTLLGIPTTESLYTQVQGSEYNIGYRFVKKVVIKDYPVQVRKDYILTWTNAKDKTKTMTETATVTKTVTVRRACAYWEIEYFDYYTFNKATVYNNALPGGETVMYANGSYYTPPTLVLNHQESEAYHISAPSSVTSGIDLPSVSLSAGSSVKPCISSTDITEEAIYAANTGTGEITVKNDYLSFNGSVIMEDSLHVKETNSLTNLSVINEDADICGENVFYKSKHVIETTLLNNIYASHGTLAYTNTPYAVASSGSTYEIPIEEINSVTVHTPVICEASIKTTDTATNITSNDPYVQVLNVDQDCVQLVLDTDENLSDFTIDIKNYGKHLSINGYFTRDFAWCLRDPLISYIAKKNNIYRNEVKFPFDVYYRNPTGVDTYIPKDTWMRFGHNTPTYYLPMWVDEGTYTAQFRTIAVNGVNTDSQLSLTQAYANTDRTNYVATDTVRVQVSGRIYGLSIYDVTDYPNWETVFRISEGSAVLKMNNGNTSGVTKEKFNAGYAYDYTVGTADQYGKETGRLEKYTLPLVNGSHPKITNIGVLKTGYAVKFKVNTIGNAFSSADKVLIKPKFYYVDANGENRQQVDVYYTEYFNKKSHNLVKMGSALDLTNIKSYRCGEQYFGIPKSQLQIMADIKKVALGNYRWEETDLFSYTNIKIRLPLMTYVNTSYLNKIKNSDQYDAIKAAGVKEVSIVNRMQTYYAEYYFPADVKAVAKDYDVYGYASKYGVTEHEDFWLTGGYIIINFDIVTVDSHGNKNLSYINASNATKGYCSMWSMENPVPYKKSYNGKRYKSTFFNFRPGDFMVYYTDKNVNDDYSSHPIN